MKKSKSTLFPSPRGKDYEHLDVLIPYNLFSVSTCQSSWHKGNHPMDVILYQAIWTACQEQFRRLLFGLDPYSNTT